MEEHLIIEYLLEQLDFEIKDINHYVETEDWSAVQVAKTRRKIIDILLDRFTEPKAEFAPDVRVALLEKELEIQKLKNELEKEKHNVKEKIVYLPQYQNVPFGGWDYWRYPYYTNVSTSAIPEGTPITVTTAGYLNPSNVATDTGVLTSTPASSGSTIVSNSTKPLNIASTTATAMPSKNVHPCMTGVEYCSPGESAECCFMSNTNRMTADVLDGVHLPEHWVAASKKK